MTERSDVPAQAPASPSAEGGSRPVTVTPPAGEPDVETPLTHELVQLAHAYGVATEFWDWQGRHTVVSRRTVLAVLAALGVDASGPAAVAAALAEVRDRPWRQTLPDVVVVREGGTARVAVHVEHGTAVEVWVELEADGDRRTLEQEDRWIDPRVVDGRLIGEASFLLPDDLPTGWHQLHATTSNGPATSPLVVTPQRLELPEAVQRRRAWGFMTQLYSVRSKDSWGLGDLADLAELADWSARRHGAGFVLVNPMHAAQPVPPMEPSPYLPTSRRFLNPIYLRVEDIREVAYLPATERAVIEWQADEVRALNSSPAELDRDTVWEAKKSALEAVFAAPRSAARQASFEAFCAREGQGLVDFATWCSLAERYGLPTRTWPAHALDPRGPAVEELRRELAARVRFHMWLQWCLDEQAQRAQRAAVEAGMPIGVVHDLAVGVHPDGADAWALSGVLAQGVTVGAPPDAFNQQGQDWSQPPWRPDRLAELGYAPYRDMLRTVLRHSGALRVDHIIGLFRLWWVPAGVTADAGTYVRYDHEALVGILALEAQRAGAFVVGEDLGTVEPWARDYLRERGLLGTSILWFEKDGAGRPLRPEHWRELCLATVTTHDLPPTAGYLAAEHVHLRQKLGLLTRPLAEELAVDQADREAVLGQLRELGLLGPEAGERNQIEALHRFLTWTPARLIGVALADAVGDRRTMNQPGTCDEYPNWRLPLADGAGRPVLLEDLMQSLRVAALARTVNGR
ncbi:MAG TPA: 4-alpha-glucanotransferase [Kineosporiaceae bacterium]|nr:4-alpha-glucanotransferase [Kineosporiaceae bacterium]